MQTAAFQVALQLLSGPTPSRIPFHGLLDASIMALQSWVDYEGAFMDHPLYAKWSQRLLAMLHVLWKASWPQEAQKMAGMRLTKVSILAHHRVLIVPKALARARRDSSAGHAGSGSTQKMSVFDGLWIVYVCMQVLPEVILECGTDPAFRLQLCQLLVDCAKAQSDGIAAFHPLLPLLTESSRAARCLAGGLRRMLAGSKAQQSPESLQSQGAPQVRSDPLPSDVGNACIEVIKETLWGVS